MVVKIEMNDPKKIDIPEGTIIKSDSNLSYEVGKYLGQGGVGTIYSARCLEIQKNFALKVGKKSGDAYRDQLNNEVNVYDYIRINVTKDDLQYFGKIYESFDRNEYSYIISELYLNDLYFYFRQRNNAGFSMRDIQRILRDLASGVHIIHKINVVHTGLKPENMMVTKEGRIKIIDFGSAALDQDDFSGKFQTLNYRSPESILRLKMGPGVDIWSFGCIAFELLFGCPLFYGSNELNMLQLMQLRLGTFPNYIIRNSPRVNDYFDKENVINVDTFIEREEQIYLRRNLKSLMFSVKTKDSDLIPLLYDLVKNCLHFDPDKRLLAKDIINHPFLMHEF